MSENPSGFVPTEAAKAACTAEGSDCTPECKDDRGTRICEAFDRAADHVAAATKKFVDAGMSGIEAGKVAIELFKFIAD